MEHVFLGLNINIDAIMHIETTDQFIRIQQLLEQHCPEILPIFTDAVSGGYAREELVPSTLVSDILSEFEHEQVLGGQEGFFFQNTVRSFKHMKPVLHLPNRSVKMVEFVKTICPTALVFEDNGLMSISDIQTTNEAAPVHIVAEYPAGLVMPDGSVVHRANRFILTFDETNSNLVLDEHLFMNMNLIDKDWAVLISGHHLISVDKLTDEFKNKHTTLMQTLADRAGWVHYEMAFQSDKVVRDYILDDLIPKASSVGLNEVELRLFAETCCEEYCAEDTLPQTLIRFTNDLQLPQVFFHTLGLYVAIGCKSPFSKAAYDYGMHIGERVILDTRAVEDSEAFYVDLKHDLTEFDTVPDTIDKEKLVYFKPKILKPISSTVGLGDTISSSIVLGVCSHTD
ncbi:hypothetical protein PCE1_003728 [Barthelona sp. PCE]